MPLSEKEFQRRCDDLITNRDALGWSALLEVVSPHGIPGVLSHKQACQLAFDRAFLSTLDWEHSVDPNMSLQKFKLSPLEGYFIQMMDACLAGGANVDSFIDQLTPLTRASQSGLIDLVRYLIEKGADLNPEPFVSNKQFTVVPSPLTSALIEHHDEVAFLLIEKGADIEACDEEDNTPMAWAVKMGRTQVRNHLLEKGAYLHTVNAHNQNLLHNCLLSLEEYSTETGVETLSWLARLGVDPHQENWNGLSALAMAQDTEECFISAINGGLAQRAADQLDKQTPASPASLQRSRL